MIRYAKKEDRNEIKRIRKEVSETSGNFEEFQNKYLFIPERTLVNDRDGSILAVVELRPHTIILGNKKLGCFLMTGFACAKNASVSDIAELIDNGEHCPVSEKISGRLVILLYRQIG